MNRDEIEKIVFEARQRSFIPDFQGANLRNADLQGADLQDANLQDANLDFSSGIPLWCGGTRMKLDNKQVSQILAHLCSCDVSDEARIELDKVLRFAKTSHRAKDCGLLEKE